jgi:Glycosyltransferase like family 2
VISVCIPAYEMHGHGATFLGQLLGTIEGQTFSDVEVVVSDHSADSAVELECAAWADRLTLAYRRNEAQRGSSSANLNNAVRHATGEIVKPMHQDDFFASPRALEQIATAFHDRPEVWGAVGFVHRRSYEGEPYRYRVPAYNDDILRRNTIGAPSTVFFRAGLPEELDPELIWTGDVDFYYRLRRRYGDPLVLSDALVCIRQWEHQVTNTRATDERRARELAYTLEKHGLDPPEPTAPQASRLRDRLRPYVPRPALGALRAAREGMRRAWEAPALVRAHWMLLRPGDDPLTRLANRHGSGKGTFGLAPAYHRVLAPLRERPLTLVELGPDSDRAVWVWADYFPRARIFGVDLDEHSRAGRNRVTRIAADPANPWDLERAAERIGARVDVVVDASGQPEAGLEVLLPQLAPGGVYIVEDPRPAVPAGSSADLIASREEIAVDGGGRRLLVLRRK